MCEWWYRYDVDRPSKSLQLFLPANKTFAASDEKSRRSNE